MADKPPQDGLSRPLRWWRGLRWGRQVPSGKPVSAVPIPGDGSLTDQPNGQGGDVGRGSVSQRDLRQEDDGGDAGFEPPRVASHQRIYAIGDIHGRHDLLVKLLAQIERDARARTDGREVKLVFLGDYVDRGDESAKVLGLLLALSRDRTQDVSFLEGNHEAAMVDFLADPVRGRAWLDHGGRQTLASYGIRPPDAAAKEAQFLQARDNFKEALGGHLEFLGRLQLMETSGAVLFVMGLLAVFRVDFGAGFLDVSSSVGGFGFSPSCSLTASTPSRSARSLKSVGSPSSDANAGTTTLQPIAPAAHR